MNSSELTGRIHSLETLGAADGPGLRLIIFMQGCPLACRFCHNPDTWATNGGSVMSVAELVRKAQRYQPYFGADGGVTLSGGEPLAQPTFTAALLRALKAAGLKTALDTSGYWLGDDAARQEILANTDLVLLDVKSPDPEKFKWLTGRPIEPLLEFIAACERAGTPVWIRQVIVPGFNDTEADVRALIKFQKQWPQLQVARIQLLGYHTLGSDKWRQLGRVYPLAGTPAMDAAELEKLQAVVDELI